MEQPEDCEAGILITLAYLADMKVTPGHLRTSPLLPIVEALCKVSPHYRMESCNPKSLGSQPQNAEAMSAGNIDPHQAQAGA